MLMLVITASGLAQNTAKKWIRNKCTAMKEQVKTDLQLSTDEAEKYYQIILDKYTKDAEKTKKLTSDEEKKAHHTESFKAFNSALKLAFGDEKASLLQKWTKENQSKFNKK